MGDSTARLKRPLNARIESAAWLEHEDYIRENYGHMDQNDLLENLQARGLPISKHQLTHQLSKWGLKKYKARSATLHDEFDPDRIAFQRIAASISSNTSNESITPFVPILPKSLSADVSRFRRRLHEISFVPFDSPALKTLPPVLRCPFGAAESEIFCIADRAATKSLVKIGLNSAAVVSAYAWWDPSLRSTGPESTSDSLLWTNGSLSLLAHLQGDWSVINLKYLIDLALESSCLMNLVVRDMFVLEGAWRSYRDSCSASQSITPTETPDAWLCYYENIKRELRIRVKGSWPGNSKALIWEIDLCDLPKVQVRDERLELELHELLLRLIKASNHVTNVEFNHEVDQPWGRLTPFEVISIAVNIYYLRQDTADSRRYAIRPIGEKKILETFRSNVLRMLDLLVQHGQLCENTFDEINFTQLILNMDMGSDYTSYDDELIERMGDGKGANMFFEPVSVYSIPPEYILSPSIQQGGPDVAEEASSFSAQQPALMDSKDLTDLAAPATHLNKHQAILPEPRLADSEPLTSSTVLMPSVPHEMEAQQPFHLNDSSSESGDDQNTLKERSDAITRASSSRRSSPGDCSLNDPSLQSITLRPEQAHDIVITHGKRHGVYNPSSESYKSGQSPTKKNQVTEIIDPTLASGVVVAQEQQAVQREVDWYAIPTLSSSLSSMQISDLRGLQHLHSAKAFGLDSHLSLPSTKSGSLDLPTLKSYGYRSISTGRESLSTGSASSGPRRKRVKRSKDSHEDKSVNKRVPWMLRFN